METTERLKSQLLDIPKGRIKWYFDFLNLEIDGLSSLDGVITSYCLGLIVGETYAVTDYELEKVWKDSQEERTIIKEIQNLLKETMDGIISCKEKLPPRNLEIVQKFLKKERLITDDDIKYLLEENQRLANNYLVKDYQMSMHVVIRDNHTYIEPIEKRYKILFDFLDTLSSFPVDYIRHCERSDCVKYFIQLTAKEKRYCSNRCAWVMNSRMRRATSTERGREETESSYTINKSAT
jgi:hypothetical protein